MIILACKSIVLCMRSGKYIDIYISLKITFPCNYTHLFVFFFFFFISSVIFLVPKM